MSGRGQGRPRHRGGAEGHGPPRVQQHRRHDHGQGRPHNYDPHRQQERPQDRNAARGRGQQFGRRHRQGQPPDHDVGPDLARRLNYLTIDDMKRLAGGTPAAIVACINENEAGFLAAYKFKGNCEHPLGLKRLIKILYNLLKSNEENLASRVLGQVLSKSGEFSLFLFQVDQLLKNMPMETRVGIQRENPQYLNYLLEIGHFAIEHIPETVTGTFPVVVLDHAIQQLSEQGEQLDTLKRRSEELKTLFKEVQNEMRKARMPPKLDPSLEQAQPPEHFTTIEVLPAPEEIQYHDRKPFLRPNKVKGCYDNWDHYLDVQFRLLREDFIAPLRNGIDGYYNGLTGRKLQDVRIYNHVHVQSPVCLFSGMGFQIQFDVSHFNRVKWEYSRRLIFGSLLCLSKDDFKTMLFATVVKRDPEQLQHGLLTIRFEGDHVNGFEIDPAEEFTMVESTAYFEAYRHILRGLQYVSVVKDTMPLKPYIVECKMQEIPSPLYIRSTGSVSFDMNEALGLKKAKPKINITNPTCWPHVDDTSLDESQLEAIQMALKQEISVIQGPPGTGKTYIGLKIVQAFLKNRQVWDRQRNSPILIVCYTNHALDQFLEGIKGCSIEGKEPAIVRIGGRCKSEKLASCVLAKKVENCRAERSFPRSLHQDCVESRNAMLHIKNDVDRAVEEIEKSGDKIIPLSTLENVVLQHHRFQLIQGIPTDVGKEIEVWLGLWYAQPQEDLPPENPEDDDTALARALEASLADIPPVEVPPGHLPDQDADAASSDGDYIQVDNEARLLQEDRMLEGEEIELDNQHVQKEDVQFTEADPYYADARANDFGWQVVQMSDKERKKRINRGFRFPSMKHNEAKRVVDIHALNLKKKWGLYHYWVNEYLKLKKRALSTKAAAYNEICEVYSEMQQQQKNFAIRGADVIGMTTTGAAKHHHILRNIHPKIVVVEEAAEVFESHIVTSLSPSVQQLILIGDHKQLRPKPNCYELEKKYEFAVSLFERLTINNIPYVTLGVQHRMRPEIARLVCPHIYDHLENHISVKRYDHVAGIGKDVAFIDHAYPEQSNPDGDMRSHSNVHEAKFLVELCRYLLKQGYKPGQVTLLTMYRGQLLEMKNKMRRADFEGVRVAAVDDFQGEENDIILLSLVRSNSDGEIGFLKIPNRICVSLSRAKQGFYVIGNLAMLRDKDATVWPRILQDMDQRQCVCKALPLYCQVHPEEKIAAKTAEDFTKCPEGGCQKPCGSRLPCGHVCPRLCHPTDREHKLYKCHKKCVKTLPCGHKCTRQCHECIKQCQPCSTIVLKEMPGCGHTLDLPCHVDPHKANCINQCTKPLPCGHLCQEMCFQPCTVRCSVVVEKSLQCGHKAQVYCHIKPDDISCPMPCEELIDCDHSCSGTCGECNRGRLHKRCQYKCDRTLVCGHICRFPCTPNCPPCLSRCSNSCVHSNCPKLCYEPCSPCMEPCQWRCEHFVCTSKCGEPCNRPPCNQPCRKRLNCGHPCISLCGEKCPLQCRICDHDEVCEIFFGNEDEEDARFIELQDCGHVIEVEALDYYMEMNDSQAEGKPQEVQLKCCPKCKVPIRKSLRYGNIIKRTLVDLEQIKKRQLVTVDKDGMKQQLKEVTSKMEQSSKFEYVVDDVQKIRKAIAPPRRYLSPHQFNAIHTQLTYLPKIVELFDTLSSLKCKCIKFAQCTIKISDVDHDISVLQKFLMQEFLSDQQLKDIQSELRRLICTTKLCDLKVKVETVKCKLELGDEVMLNKLAAQVHVSGWQGPKMAEDLSKQVTTLITHFSQKYNVSGLSESERMEITKAMGFSKGHWFKCPNDHLYCIGDCGGAMEVAKCPECGAQIGGQSHALVPGNRLAPEMDGARHAAWSDATNLENYDREELQRLFGN